MQEEETMYKVYKLIQSCDKLKQIKNEVFVNIEVRYIFHLSYENKFTIPLIVAKAAVALVVVLGVVVVALTLILCLTCT